MFFFYAEKAHMQFVLLIIKTKRQETLIYTLVSTWNGINLQLTLHFD